MSIKNVGWSLLCAILCVAAMLFGGWLEHEPLSYVMGGVACLVLAFVLLKRIDDAKEEVYTPIRDLVQRATKHEAAEKAAVQKVRDELTNAHKAELAKLHAESAELLGQYEKGLAKVSAEIGLLHTECNQARWFDLRRLYPDLWVSALDIKGQPIAFSDAPPYAYLAFLDNRGISKIVMLAPRNGMSTSVWDGYHFIISADDGGVSYQLPSSNQTSSKGVGWNKVEDIPGHGRTFIPARTAAEAIQAYLQLKGRKSAA